MTKSTTCFRKTGGPLTEYSSKDEAMQGAEHANSTYSQDLTPYHCDKCSKWHLSPKTRITPSETCNLCTDRDGKNKKLYFEEAAAQKRAQIIFDEEHIKLRVYKCKFSEGWHLTKDS